MTILALLFTALATPVLAADPAPSPTIPSATPASATSPAPVPIGAPTSAEPSPAVPANAVNIPAGPTVKDKSNEYSARTVVQTCTATNKERCVIDTMVGATRIGESEPVWDRRIFFQHYDLEKPIESQAISVKSVKIVGKKTLVVTNSRGDSFELELGHGHLKRPKKARKYSK